MDNERIASLLDKPISEFTVREGITLIDFLDHATDEELAELELPATLNT